VGERSGYIYDADFPIGTFVRVADRSTLELFMATWKWHHPLESSQLEFAGKEGEVTWLGFYHGGEELYQIEGIPGIWPGQCLEPVTRDIEA
jgi:hypothetical protein